MCSYLRSIRQTWVSLDFPEPQGSMRYLDARTTPWTPPMSGASGCSTEVETNTQAPLVRSVLHVLKYQQIIFNVRGIIYPIHVFMTLWQLPVTCSSKETSFHNLLIIRKHFVSELIEKCEKILPWYYMISQSYPSME